MRQPVLKTPLYRNLYFKKNVIKQVKSGLLKYTNVKYPENLIILAVESE